MIGLTIDHTKMAKQKAARIAAEADPVWRAERNAKREDYALNLEIPVVRASDTASGMPE
jgi:hypothetical protein